MDRRKFLKQVSLWSTGMIASSPVFTIPAALFAATHATPEIIVRKNRDYSKLVDDVVNELGGLSKFIKSGDKVVIKPNMGWDRTVDQGANTHPVVIARLCTLALEAGASQVLVFDRTCNEERRCYQNSGIKPIIETLGDRRIKCRYIDERRFVPVKIEKGRAITEWSFYKDALEADCYINVPVAKHHGLSGLTLGLKNIMGVIGGHRGRIHFNLAQHLADLNTVIPVSLTIVDATRILLRNGPQGGRLSDVRQLDTLIAGTDPVACDAYATTLFGLQPPAVKSTVAAYEMGLGQMDLSLCKINR